METDLGVNNSYSIDLFEQRAAQIIQVNNQKVKLKEIRFQELHKNFGSEKFYNIPFLKYCRSLIFRTSITMILGFWEWQFFPDFRANYSKRLELMIITVAV